MPSCQITCWCRVPGPRKTAEAAPWPRRGPVAPSPPHPSIRNRRSGSLFHKQNKKTVYNIQEIRRVSHVDGERTVTSDAVRLPVVGLEVGGLGRPHDDVLHVAPSQIVVGFQGEGADASREWGRG